MWKFSNWGGGWGGPPLGNFSHIIPFFSLTTILRREGSENLCFWCCSFCYYLTLAWLSRTQRAEVPIKPVVIPERAHSNYPIYQFEGFLHNPVFLCKCPNFSCAYLHQRCSVLHHENPSLPIMQDDVFVVFIVVHLTSPSSSPLSPTWSSPTS